MIPQNKIDQLIKNKNLLENRSTETDFRGSPIRFWCSYQTNKITITWILGNSIVKCIAGKGTTRS